MANNQIIEELKNSFLVKGLGYSLILAAETYDEMDGTTEYQDAVKEAQE